jgi:hypothetical protein
MIFYLSFKGSIDEGLHELLREVFDILKTSVEFVITYSSVRGYK